MSNITITIKTLEKKGVLDKITKIITFYGLNIVYNHLYVEKSNLGFITLELENVENVDSLINELSSLKIIQEVKIHESLNDIYGKRVIIFGGGAQVSQVAMGAITEADRHNIRGERISVDTTPLVGEDDIAKAVEALSRLPRVSALVLAGSIMGGEITKVVEKVKKDHNLVIISLNMAGGASKHADLIVTDPIQAGVMAVMAIADTAIFDIKKLKTNKF
jgi:energy-converting hydrogenase B subunit Q